MPKKDNPLLGKTITPVEKETPELGIDTDKTLHSDILDAVEVSQLDVGVLEGFNQTAQTRESIYTLIDSMMLDATISAVIETYAEDVTETNDKGDIVWVESNNSEASKYISFLIASLNINKKIKSWATHLCTYGDLYVKLYRGSDYEDDVLFGSTNKKSRSLNEEFNANEQLRQLDETVDGTDKQTLNEDVYIKVHEDADHYVHHIDMVPNPAEMFELSKYGKTMGFIKASVANQKVLSNSNFLNNYTSYKIKKQDVTVYDSTDFVHASLDLSSNRYPETVDIISGDNDSIVESSYTVKNGQSILQNIFKIWRELSLLENSVLLNRVTRSAFVRIFNIEVGDMPKERVASLLENLKSKIEQKSALNVGDSMTEYSSPGPVDNVIYVPTHEGKGQITLQNLGGDVDAKKLTDIEHFQEKMFGALRIPKQFFGLTDGAGFDGGKSLSILSSRYGKAVKDIQNVICNMITDIVNLFLWDKGLTSYINKFNIRMQSPLTQEELDRRSNKDNRVRYISDIMNQLSDKIETKSTKLKIVKNLLAPVVDDAEVLACIDDEIALNEKEEEKAREAQTASEENTRTETPPEQNAEISSESPDMSRPAPRLAGTEEEPDLSNESEFEATTPPPTSEPSGDSYIPSPAELGIDATNTVD